FPRNEPPNPAKYLSERPEMTTHDGKSRKAKTRKTKSTKGTKGEITQILQTHSGDHVCNRPRVATIRPARPSRLHRDAAASRARCRRDRKRIHQLDWTDPLWAARFFPKSRDRTTAAQRVGGRGYHDGADFV